MAMASTTLLRKRTVSGQCVDTGSHQCRGHHQGERPLQNQGEGGEVKDIPLKSCLTCAHRSFGHHCELTGWPCCVQRQWPSPPCDINLSGWVQRPKRRGLLTWLKDLLF